MQKHYSYLDIDIGSKIYKKLRAIQGDIKSRYISVNLYANNLSFDLSNCTVKIFGIKKDKTVFFNNAVIKNAEKGQFEIELTNQALAVSGELKIQILVLGTSGEKLTSSAFFIDVGESIIDENAIESTNEFTTFTQAMADFQTWDGKFEEKYDGLETEYAENLTSLGSQIKDKANVNEVIKKGEVDLDEMTERTLQAIQGGEGTSFELLSIPRDLSVSINKVDEDLQTILFPKKSIKYPINNLDETTTTHINANVRFIQKEIIPKNSYLSSIDVFLGSDSSLVGGTLKLELFSIDEETLTKYYEKSFTGKLGVNKLDINILIKRNTYISFSRTGYALLKYKQGTEDNCYYASNITDSTLSISSLSFGSFTLSMKAEVLDLGIRPFKLEVSNILLVDKENGDFNNIQDAINSITDDGELNPYIIRVGQGIFERFSMRSSVTGIDRMRYISIIGENKYTSIIKDDTGHYVTGSCDIWNKGTIENLTVEMSHENDISEENRKSYALHFDFGQCDTEVRNCILISHQAPAVGVGLYQDTNIKFKDCELYNLCPSNYGSLVDYGAIFCHSQNAENIINQNIKLENCKVISQNGNKAAWFSKIGTGGEMIVESINTMYYSHKEGVGVKVENNAKLSPYSYGNNAINLNN